MNLDSASTRYVTEEPDPRERFVLYRLCDCLTCHGRGQVNERDNDGEMIERRRCRNCRGEGRVRQELATCESPEAVGVALVTLAQEGEFEECPIGLLERGAGKNGAGRWLILPWLPSPRNASDAGKLLRSRRKPTEPPKDPSNKLDRRGRIQTNQ